MINRRRFLQCLAASAASPPIVRSARGSEFVVGPLRADPDGLLDLPDGFSYRVISKSGDAMDDGLKVPPAHDGMAAFPGPDGRVILVCNHETALSAPASRRSPTG
jgi:secreted PhoX family phosphatase